MGDNINGDFGYFLPERRLGNYELTEFAKLIGLPNVTMGWYTRSVEGRPLLVKADPCWQNYFCQYTSPGNLLVKLVCDYFKLHEAVVFVSYQFGRRSIQFTLTEEAEQLILNALKTQTSYRVNLES